MCALGVWRACSLSEELLPQPPTLDTAHTIESHCAVALALLTNQKSLMSRFWHADTSDGLFMCAASTITFTSEGRSPLRIASASATMPSSLNGESPFKLPKRNSFSSFGSTLWKYFKTSHREVCRRRKFCCHIKLLPRFVSIDKMKDPLIQNQIQLEHHQQQHLNCCFLRCY